MVDMDHEVAWRERRQLIEKGVGALAAPLPANEAVAEHVLLGEQRHVRGREAMIERKHDQRGRALGRSAQRLLPVLHKPRASQPMVLEEPA